ncbi:MAG: LytTR family DNA-binding domain-containing protein [Firmicutes bacterium]|nr:LytTR family DNA-binding domain-containing protein [Bacillota bacterium]
MKIHIIQDDRADEPEVTITCREITEDIQRAITAIRAINCTLTGVREGQTFILQPAEVVYIDTADKRTFIYTAGDVYETPLRLYELEQQLPNADFFRANKSCIIGMRHIRSIKADIDGRLLLTMDSGEKLWVSRQYAAEFRRKIGM